TGNYNNTAGAVSDEIKKAGAVCSVTGYSVTYDANPHSATGSCTGDGGTPDVPAGVDLSCTTHTNAVAPHSDPWTFTDVTGNYNKIARAASREIKKADAACSATGNNVTYDGNPHSATGSCTGVGGPSDTPAGLDLSGTTHDTGVDPH